MSIALDMCCLTISLVMPVAYALSVWMGVGFVDVPFQWIRCKGGGIAGVVKEVGTFCFGG
jgi:hypothetical protein